jgi:hypothetical protein
VNDEMSEEIIENKDGVKIRKLTELRTNSGKEYEEVMLKRVEYFAKKNAEKSVFNNLIQNTVVKSLSTILDLKVKADKAIGEDNIKKFNKAVEELLLFGL